MMKISMNDVKEALPVVGGFLLAVYLFGRLVDKQVDTDKNWQDYIDRLKTK